MLAVRAKSRQAELAEERAQELRARRLSFRPDDVRSTSELLIRWALEGGLNPEDVAPYLDRATELLLWSLVFDLGLPFEGGAL